jgi:hypothetical protein
MPDDVLMPRRLPKLTQQEWARVRAHADEIIRRDLRGRPLEIPRKLARMAIERVLQAGLLEARIAHEAAQRELEKLGPADPARSVAEKALARTRQGCARLVRLQKEFQGARAR